MSGPSGISLLLADVDGTLVTDGKVLTEASLAAVAALRAAGIGFAIASSRPPRGMRPLMEPLGITTPAAGFNGGVFFKPDFSIIAHHTIDPDTARRGLALMFAHGLDAWVYTEDEWLVRDRTGPIVAREVFTLGFEPRVVPVFSEAHLARAVKIVGVAGDIAQVAAAEPAVRNELGMRASVARLNPHLLDVTHPQANKGEVVTMLSGLLNIPPMRIATIGDGSNDVAMFRASGFSIAMGNAIDEVKSCADVVTGGNDEEGFANAVRRFILPPGGA